MRLQEPPEIPAPGAPLFCGTLFVIPGRAAGASPESIITKSEVSGLQRRSWSGGDGFRARHQPSRLLPTWTLMTVSGKARDLRRSGMTGGCAPRPRRAHHCRPSEQGVPHGRRRPVRQVFRSRARHRERGGAAGARGGGQQSQSVHLQRHGQLHHRPRQGGDPRSRPGRRRPCGGAARRRARRDGDAHLRHPYPSRPFAGGAQGQGGDRRKGFRPRPAPARPSAAYRRDAPARRLGRHGFSSRRGAYRWRDRERRWLDS